MGSDRKSMQHMSSKTVNAYAALFAAYLYADLLNIMCFYEAVVVSCIEIKLI